MMIGKAGRARLRWIMELLLVFAIVHLALTQTGLGDWVERTPAAIGAVHVFGVLFFGGSGLVILFVPDRDPPRRLREWFIGALCLLFAIVNAVSLFGGRNT
jgi:hypothetical protein